MTYLQNQMQNFMVGKIVMQALMGVAVKMKWSRNNIEDYSPNEMIVTLYNRCLKSKTQINCKDFRTWGGVKSFSIIPRKSMHYEVKKICITLIYKLLKKITTYFGFSFFTVS